MLILTTSRRETTRFNRKTANLMFILARYVPLFVIRRRERRPVVFSSIAMGNRCVSLHSVPHRNSRKIIKLINWTVFPNEKRRHSKHCEMPVHGGFNEHSDGYSNGDQRGVKFFQSGSANAERK